MFRTKVLLLASSLLTSFYTQSQSFEKFSPSFSSTPSINVKTEWIDVDKDQDLDLLSFYYDSYDISQSFIKLYENNNGSFIEVNDPFNTPDPVIPSAYVFGDYDLDGDVDFLFLNYNVILIAKNNGNLSFTLEATSLNTNYSDVSIYWFDIDSDGDLDIVYPPEGLNYVVLLNNNGAYTKSIHPLSVFNRTFSWADVNNDGLLDFISAKGQTTSNAVYLHINQGDGVFKADEDPLISGFFDYGKSIWRDADADGDIDLFLTESNNKCTLFKNTFSETGTLRLKRAYQFEEVALPSTQMADMNGDGLPDLVLNGDAFPLRKTFLYINQSTTDSLKFVGTALDITTSSVTNLNLIDIDQDKDLDIFLTGTEDIYTGDQIFHFYRNLIPATTTLLAVPTELQSDIDESVLLSWEPVQHAGTVRYKVEVKRNGSLFMSSMSTETGTLIKPENEQQLITPNLVLRNLDEGTYTWRVQAVDATNNPSGFSEYSEFTIASPPNSLVLQKLKLTTLQLTWANAGPQPTAFHIFRRFENQPVEEIASVPGNGATYTDNNLIANQHYEYFVKSDNAGVYSPPSNTVTYYSGQFEETPFPTANNIVAANSLSADIDNDQDYDLLVLGGLDYTYGSLFSLKNNGAGSYTTTPTGQPSDNSGSPDFIMRDLDNDGDEDLSVVVTEFAGGRVSVFENVNGTFTKVFSSDFYHVFLQFAVEDFNNDGLLDLFYTHASSNNTGTHGYRLLYQKSINDFEDSRFPFVEEYNRELNYFTVGDFNNDGFKDILVPGTQYNTKSIVFVNLNGKSFKRTVVNLPNTAYPCAFDYDQDGKLDVITVGGSTIIVYKGNGDLTFDDPFEVEVTGVYFSGKPNFQVADFDLNGYPDLLMNGGYQFSILQNFGNGEYRPMRYTFAIGDGTQAVISDIENDGDLDIVSFAREQHEGKNLLYLNNIISSSDPSANLPPGAPANVQASVSGGAVKLSWTASADDHTPSRYISYNLQVKDTNGKIYVHPETNPAGTFRKIIAGGNAGHRTDYSLTDLKAGNYLAKVQALDANFRLSPFSNEIAFTVSQGPSNLTIERVLLSKVNLQWTDGMNNETKIVVQRKTIESDYEVVEELPPNTTTYTDDVLLYNQIYTYRVYAVINAVPTAASNLAEWNTAILIAGETDLPNIHGALDIGDYTGDGKMDMLMTGGRIVNGSTTDLTSAVFENAPAGWISQDVGTTLPSTITSNFDDYNGDYRLDIYKHKFVYDISKYETEVFLNKGDKTFMGPSDIFNKSDFEFITWWDYDSDNDLDVMGMESQTYSPHNIRILENQGSGTYNQTAQSTPCDFICNQAIAGDFDNDGDEDILKYESDAYTLWLNVEGKLIDSNVSLPSYARGRINTIDYNGDGWLDIYFISVDYNFGNEKSKLYKNLGTDDTNTLSFKMVKDDLPVGDASYSWADFDHDGDLDLFATAGRSTIYFNAGNDDFESYTLPQFFVNFNGTKWIDFDNDGDLDLYVAGYVKVEGSDQPKGYVLYNQIIVSTKGISNQIPAAPTQLTSIQDEEGMHLSWQHSNDDHTPDESITYDVVLYKDGKAISKGSLNPATGFRTKLQHGRSTGKILVDYITHGNYTWKVQAVDQSYLGSSLSAEGEFFFKPRPPLLNDTVIYRCARTIALTAKGENIEWFSDANLTTKIGSGVFSPQSSQTVYATQTIDGIRGIANRVAITIYEQPEKPGIEGINPYTFCENTGIQEIYLQASGENLRWYKDKNKVTLLVESTDLIVPALDSAYYVSQTIQGCEGPTEEVKVKSNRIDSRLYYDDGKIYTYEEDGTQYNWFYNSNPISNSNTNFITADGEGSYSVYIQKNFCGEFSFPFVVTGIEATDEDIVKIYPNPTSGDFNVQFTQLKDASFTVRDVTGKQVYTRGQIHSLQPIPIFSKHWTKGVYFITISQGNRIISKKIVVL